MWTYILSHRKPDTFVKLQIWNTFDTHEQPKQDQKKELSVFHFLHRITKVFQTL